MRCLAAIFSCLILLLSAGVGDYVATPAESGCCKTEVAQTESCGCCCCGEGEQGDGCGDESAPRKSCPFCNVNTCPGFFMTTTVVVPAMLADLHAGECMFIQNGYVSPSDNGIWQPPKTV